MALPEGLIQQLEAKGKEEAENTAPANQDDPSGQKPLDQQPEAGSENQPIPDNVAPNPEPPAPEADPITPAPEAKPAEFDFSAYAQKAGREIKSSEDLSKWIDEISKPKAEPQPLEAEIQSLAEWKSKGGTTESWYQVHHTDWSKQADKDPREVLFQYHKANNTYGLTDDEIRFQIEDQHPKPEEGSESDPETKRASIKLKTELGTALNWFNERKIKESVPAPERERQAIAERFQENVRQTTDKAMALKELQFGDYKHVIDDAFKQKVVHDPNVFLSKYVQLDDKGNLTGMNMEAITRDSFILENLNAILGSHATHEGAKTVEGLKREIANPQLKPKHESAPSGKTTKTDDEVLAEYKAGRR